MDKYVIAVPFPDGGNIPVEISPYQLTMIRAFIDQGTYTSILNFVDVAVETKVEEERQRLKLSDEEIMSCLQSLKEEFRKINN